MKKIIISFLIVSCFFGTAVMAQNLGGDKLGQVVGGVDEISKTGLEVRVSGIIAAILSMLGTIFLVLTIYAGVLWMTASGDEAKITKAKDIFKASIIGLAIVLSAYTITYFVGSRLGSGASGDGEGCCTMSVTGGGKAETFNSPQSACTSDDPQVTVFWSATPCR